MNDRSFKLRIIERLELLEREFNSAIHSIDLSENIMVSLTQSLEEKNLTEDQLEQVFVKFLLNLTNGTDTSETINAQDREGCTLLHYACALRYYVLASSLIQNGANVNIQDKSGCTPFHWAMKNRDQKMIKTLVDYVDLNKAVYHRFDVKDCSFTHPIRSNSVDGIISGMDELGLQLGAEGSPAIRKLKEREGSAHSSPRTPRTPRTPHLGVKVRQTLRPRDTMEDEEEIPEIGVYKSCRARRVEKAEDDSKKRAAKARDTKVAQKRK
jgi:ankyrin repeat protein